MSGGDLVAELLTKSGFDDAAEPIGNGMFRIEWGAATLITGAAGESIVVYAPLFEAVPETNTEAFLRRLLELNSDMGGTAAFLVQKDGSVALQVGRGIDGLDHKEFSLMIGTVGRFADDFGDKLASEFYA